MLANGIMPEMLAAGCGIILLLLLAVAALETWILTWRWEHDFIRLFWSIYGANVFSAFSGLVTMVLASSLAQWFGAYESIPTYVRVFRIFTPLLVGIYLAQSVLTETTWLWMLGVLKQLDLRYRTAARSLWIANIASYIAIGPLIYTTVRPYFRGQDLQITDNADWSDNTGFKIYFLDPNTKHGYVTTIGRRNIEEVLPIEVTGPYEPRFVVSKDENQFVFGKADRECYTWIVGTAFPQRVQVPDDSTQLSPTLRAALELNMLTPEEYSATEPRKALFKKNHKRMVAELFFYDFGPALRATLSYESNGKPETKILIPRTAGAWFLPKGEEMLVEAWGGLYVLDLRNRRLGFLCRGISPYARGLN